MSLNPKTIKAGGFVLIALYWLSFLGMSRVAGLMEQPSAGRDSGVLRLLWDVYRAPPMLLLGSLRYILPYPEFMFIGPLIALIAGLAITCFAWWAFFRWRGIA